MLSIVVVVLVVLVSVADPTAVLRAPLLTALRARDPTNSFDPTSKSTMEIINAVKLGHFPKVDAILHLTEEIGDIDNDDGAWEFYRGLQPLSL